MFEKKLFKILIFTSAFALLGILTIMYFFEASLVSISFLLSEDAKVGVYLVSGNLKNIEIKSNVLFLSFAILMIAFQEFILIPQIKQQKD